MSSFSDCHVCIGAGRKSKEPVDYLAGPKEFRLFRWLKFHATHNIRHHGVGAASRVGSVMGPAEGKNLLSQTIGWDVREHHTEMKDARNNFCDIAHRRGWSLWRLDFDYQGGLYFTDDARVLATLGTKYKNHRATVNIRERQMAAVMQVGANADLYSRFLGILEDQAQSHWNGDQFVVNSGLNLRDIVASESYPTWDQARIAVAVDRLGVPDAAARFELTRLLCLEAGCP